MTKPDEPIEPTAICVFQRDFRDWAVFDFHLGGQNAFGEPLATFTGTEAATDFAAIEADRRGLPLLFWPMRGVPFTPQVVEFPRRRA